MRVFLLLSVLFVAAPTFAAGRWSNASGTVTTRSGETSASSREHALRKIRLYAERDMGDDRPVWLRAVESPLSGWEVQYTPGEIGARRTHGGARTLDVGEGRFISALQVCSDRAGVMRGLRVWGSALLPDGRLSPSPVPVALSERGCVQWHPPAVCGTGGVAWALKAWYDRDRGITALALRCRLPGGPA